MMALARGATIGMLGGGQIGRMFAIEAARLGFRTHVFCPQRDNPTSQVCDRATFAAYDDWDALDSFAADVDAVTLEFENIPVPTLEYLAERVSVHPSPRVLNVCQDRIAEKEFAASAGLKTADWKSIRDLEELRDAVATLGTPSILKQTRFGYDGKGQVPIGAHTDLAAAWESLGHGMGILEAFVDFDCEISVIVARSAAGDASTHPIPRNEHEGGILRRSSCPANVSDVVLARARDAAVRIAEAFELDGLVTVELFVTADDRVLINEIAPRPHNSGHWTIEGCQTSQFEQLARVVAGLPLGSTRLLHSVEMTNLLGDEIEDVERILRDAKARLHDYGKSEVRPGRKMGHFTRLL